MILCITHSKDFYTIEIVQQRLQDLGFPTFRFNSDLFAEHYKIKYEANADRCELFVATEDQKIYSSSIKAVWYRKLWNFTVPTDLDPLYKEAFVKEYRSYQHMFFNSLRHVPWINEMHVDHFVGSDKLHQLNMARTIGLHIPKSIFTNESSAILNFYTNNKNGTIVKLHSALTKSMEGDTDFFHTTKLTDSDLTNLDTLVYCPMIFQEYIPKDYELRIIYIDGTFFTGKIPSNNDTVDWRKLKEKVISWEHYTLPMEIKEKLHMYMQKLHLTFGAIDMIRNLNGDYVFLEVNPQGEWGMLQKHLHYPIGETIAEKLINRIR